ncbi:MAG: alanine dehydrogenase [Acidimicrobiales bacterium]|jgi:alanine dehydrogenase|nr:alanine dehydrogenase [Acidimicrobiales bacterium]
MSSTVIGIPTEIKTDERRVSLTPMAVGEITSNGSQVVVQSGAGEGAGFSNNQYEKAGAKIVETAEDVFKESKIIVKVKEPQEDERNLLTPEHTLFTYLHLAADKKQTEDLISSNSTCIAFETVTDDQGSLPLLTPMSAIAGRMSIQAGAHCLETRQGGAGVLLAGAPGAEPGRVVVIGCGVVGSNAVEIAVGMGAEVIVLDRDQKTLDSIDEKYSGKVKTVFSNENDLVSEVLKADLTIGAVLLPGAKAPKLVNKEMVSEMKSGSVIVDVAIDQGGCVETAHPTTHSDPTFVIDEVVHYCVANMPGAVPRTATISLTNTILPYVLTLASEGVKESLVSNPNFLNGLNIHAGKICEPAVAEAHNLDYMDPAEALSLPLN